MEIAIKSINHERKGDAPFIGALLCAINCNYNCPNCINKHLKNETYRVLQHNDIVNEVKNNPFNKGIILGGLEWTLQPNELRKLINTALINDLQVFLYTGMNEVEFKNLFQDIYQLPIYIKFGKYEEKLKVDNYYMCGVKLASSNQYIKFKGEQINE